MFKMRSPPPGDIWILKSKEKQKKNFRIMGFPTGSPTLWKLRWDLTFSFTLHLFWQREENCVCIPNTSRTSTVWRCHIKMTHGGKKKKRQNKVNPLCKTNSRQEF